MGEPMQSEQVAEQVQAMVVSLGADWPRLREKAAQVLWAVDPAAPTLAITPTTRLGVDAFRDAAALRICDAVHQFLCACGVAEGAEIGRSLRAALLAGLGLEEPALPPWVQPGAYAFSHWHGARGLNKRIVAADANGVLFAGRSEPMAAGLFLASWEPAREERPEGLHCSACGLERDYHGLCNGCVEPLRAACLEALQGCDGYSRRVDLAGGSIDSSLSLIVTAMWERSCGPARIVVSSGIGADSFRVEHDNVDFAADMFAELVVSAARGRTPPPFALKADIRPETLHRLLATATSARFMIYGRAGHGAKATEKLVYVDKAIDEPPAIVDGIATSDIRAGEVLTLSLADVAALPHRDAATWPPALSFAGIVAPTPPADGDGHHHDTRAEHGGEVVAGTSINVEPPTQRSGPAPERAPRVTTALGTEWTTYASVEEAIAAAARSEEST